MFSLFHESICSFVNNWIPCRNGSLNPNFILFCVLAKIKGDLPRIARPLEVPWTQWCVFGDTGLMKIGRMPLDEFYPLILHNRILWNGMRIVLTTCTICLFFFLPEQASLFAALWSMLVSIAVHNFKSHKKVMWRLGCAEHGTTLGQIAHIFNLEKEVWQCFFLLL